jgi:acyl-coenzyme A thioesterase PaaI-like protein
MQDPEDSPRHMCFGCGQRNPEGLHIDFDADGLKVTGRFVPRKTHQGFPDVAHGGIAAAAMDEAMGWAMYAAGAWAMTARMEVRYRKPLPLESELLVTAEVVKDRGRLLEAVAAIASPEGEVYAEAKGTFMRMPKEVSEEFNARFLGREGEPARD